MRITWSMFLGLLLLVPSVGGPAADDTLTVAAGGKTRAVVVVAPAAGKWEKQAAGDLAMYIERLSGARPAVADTAAAAAEALKSDAPLLIVGAAALKAEPSLRQALDKVAKKDPVLRADAIALRRRGNKVFLAGTNDDGHYYAVVELLRRWGCRWYLPTEIGECIPAVPTLTVGALEFAYAPPFEC